MSSETSNDDLPGLDPTEETSRVDRSPSSDRVAWLGKWAFLLAVVWLLVGLVPLIGYSILAAEAEWSMSIIALYAYWAPILLLLLHQVGFLLYYTEYAAAENVLLPWWFSVPLQAVLPNWVRSETEARVAALANLVVAGMVVSYLPW